MSSKPTLNLFEGLDSLTSGNLSWYDKLPSSEKKEASPLIIMRWLCGTYDPAQIIRINTVVNPYIFSLGSDRSLLFKLMAAATTKKQKRYFWIKSPGAKHNTLSKQVIKEYFGCSTREAEFFSTVEKDDLIAMAEELGWDQAQIKNLLTEIEKDESRSTKKPIGKQKKL